MAAMLAWVTANLATKDDMTDIKSSSKSVGTNLSKVDDNVAKTTKRVDGTESDINKA